MARWLATAAGKLFRRQGAQPPVPFEVHCRCGRVLRGLRSSDVQTPFCPACRSSLFVLPASVYPPPRLPRRKAVIASQPQVGNAARNAAGKASGTRPATNSREQPVRAAQTAPARRPAREAPARRPISQVVAESLRSVDLARLRRRMLTPVRLVLAGALAVAALTIWWIVHVRARDEAERTVVSAARLGEQALDEHDLSEAARQFDKVRAALNTLGRNDVPARVLRQTAGETTAAAGLAGSSLFDILHEAAEAAAGGTSLTWRETFQSSYRDDWVLLDAPVARTAADSGPRRFEVDFPLSDGENHAVVVADLDIFEKAVPADGKPQRVIFAAQLDDFRRDDNDAKAWQVVLRRRTAFLWADAGRLALLGVLVDDGTKQVLAEQSKQLGLSP